MVFEELYNNLMGSWRMYIFVLSIDLDADGAVMWMDGKEFAKLEDIEEEKGSVTLGASSDEEDYEKMKVSNTLEGRKQRNQEAFSVFGTGYRFAERNLSESTNHQLAEHRDG